MKNEFFNFIDQAVSNKNVSQISEAYLKAIELNEMGIMKKEDLVDIATYKDQRFKELININIVELQSQTTE